MISALALGSLFVSLAGGRSAELQRYRDERPGMGSTFEIVLYAPSEQAAREAFDAAYDRIAALNRIFSDYDAESEAGRLSRSAPMAAPVTVSAEMARVLECAQQTGQRSEGVFDVTIGPLSRLWRRARAQKRLPTSARLQEALASTGWQHLRFDPVRRTVQLTAPGMRLDFGGIAKGFANDEALAVLRDRGLPHALVNGGGDLALGAPPPDQPGWRIGIAPLQENAPPSLRMHVSQCGVATSGDAFQSVEIDGRLYSHIVDPRTGLGLSHRSSVTVIARDGVTADALATAVSVLGPDRGLPLIDQTPGAAGMIVSVEGQEVKTYRSARSNAWEILPVEAFPDRGQARE